MITYNWTIQQLDRRTSDGFVTVAHWRCDAVDGSFSTGSYGTVGWGEGAPVIPFDELTPEIVLAWVWETLNKDVTEESLAKQIDQLKNPVTVSGTPW